MRCFVDFAAGDAEGYAEAIKAHESLRSWLTANAASFGLPAELGELHEVGQETLAGVYEGATKIALTASSFAPPPPLTLPRLFLSLSTSPGLSKTTKNFVDLLTDSRSLVSKRSPHPPLRYAGGVGSKVFRIEKGFCVQGGDVTRGDGSGGESVYGGTFPDEKEGLKTPFEYGTLAMANSGKNSNSSQWFLTLANTPPQLKKLTGKYVAFGTTDLAVASSRECLERLDLLANGSGGTTVPVWIEACGLVE